jgi:hypothetical protein
MNLTTSQYTVVAYVVGLGLLLGYALVLWVEARRLEWSPSLKRG